MILFEMIDNTFGPSHVNIANIIDVQIFTLHSSMSPEDQRLIFYPTAPNVR